MSNVIFITINYGKNITFKCHVEIPEILDLTNYFNSKPQLKLQSTNKKFRCIAVIAHRGISGDSGHYIAYCRHESGWTLFDDNKAIPCKFEDCMRREDGQIVSNVFYEKI